MARRDAKLSAAFLKHSRARLDAIGPWEVQADPHNLAVVWRRPIALADAGRAVWELRFQTDSDSPNFDPDERMFALWEAYQRHHARVVEQLRAEMGLVAEACVEIRRGYSDGEPGYEVQVIVPAGDGEHVLPFVVDPKTGRLEADA